ncbi:hypothetical protein SteCoe_6891 [Stentor coeruleus]|uniref:Uncharacterized protein n=1 Tax=Stentor coeruleus TaxID=5963 RepID=A0A1R2CNZ8_9CILI|nr:hypothetical protein SteCoe_6891 [Stentor coeruleus]
MNKFSKKSDPTKESTETNRIYLEDNPEYSGLSINFKNSRFQDFYIDPLYKFPSLLNFPLPPILVDCDCFQPDSVKISDFFESLKAKSPFKKGSQVDLKDSFLQAEGHVPQNSINTSSLDLFTDNYISLESYNFNSFSSIYTDHAKESMTNTMSICEKPLTKNEFMNKQEDSVFLKILQISPECSKQRLSEKKINSKMNFSNLDGSIDDGSKRLYQKPEDQTEILSNDEAIFTGMRTDESIKKNPCLVELIPEGENENSWLMYKSMDALQKASLVHIITEEDELSSPGDEGPLMVDSGRLFLKGTASKAKLSEVTSSFGVIRKVSPKILSDSSDFILSTVPDIKLSIDFPDPLSPLLKKLVFIEQNHNKGVIIYSISTSGFGSSLAIEFSSEDKNTQIFPVPKDPDNNMLYGLMSSTSLNILLQLQVIWISCGFEHIAAVTNNGKVLTWGHGSSGCLGHGNKESLYVPSLIESLSSQNIVYIECGGYHNAAITGQGHVWVWGRGDVNQLGIDYYKLCKDEVGFVSLSPIKIDDLIDNSIVIKGLACGEAHTLLLDSEGRIYSFGWGDDGQLGIENDISMSSFVLKNMNIIQSIPLKVVKVSAGCLFSACIDEIGQVYVWGNGEQGQLGQGQSVKRLDKPKIVSKLHDEFIVDIVCGEGYALAVSQEGKAFAWGQGIAGFFKDDKLYPPGSDIICFVPRFVSYVKNTQEYLLKCPSRDSFVESLCDRNKIFEGCG